MITLPDDPSRIDGPDLVMDSVQMLREVRPGAKSVVVLVHRSDEVARNAGGSRQRELRQALGALDEDPVQLETLLKLTEKVIFDSDDVITSGSAIRRKVESNREAESGPGPDSLAVDAVARRAGRQTRRLASGDILVLLDALMSRIGGAASAASSSRAIQEEVRPNTTEETNDPASSAPPGHEILAETCNAELALLCRRKVGRLVRRMAKQLDESSAGGARRTVVQMAAVLRLIHVLRIMERRVEWRSKRLKLVDPDHEWLLLRVGAVAFAWGNSAMGPRALQEGDSEPFEEYSSALGLLGWLAWDVGIDVESSVERTRLSIFPKEDDPWYRIQVFAAFAVQLASNPEAQEALSRAVERTAPNGIEGGAWLAAHLRAANRLVELVGTSQEVQKPDRSPRPGDLVILRSGFDPRVRIALEVAPSGATEKITVFDRENDDERRKILASHVTFCGALDTVNLDRLGSTARQAYCSPIGCRSKDRLNVPDCR